jgi:ribosomal protein S18 acetylase RimI-like enzyme
VSPVESGISKRLIYQRVAELHIQCISQGFLATLGPHFLSLMYEAIDEGDESILHVQRDGGEIIGFVAGANGLGPIYRRMIRRWPRLVRALIPALLSPLRVWRMLEIIRYGSGSPQSGEFPSAELLAIGVLAPFRSRGHAEALYRALCDSFRGKGIARFRITVGEGLRPAHRFYQRMGAVAAGRVAVHRGEPSVVYVASVNS